MDYLSDIMKIVRKYVNDSDGERCRHGLKEIANYINNEEKEYFYRREKRQGKGLIL